eukprot:CAMPEP_0116899636 /NCGR_PEP_ID=MMETSP0467-20121206/8142_1 /TAXON_ID=283647 /ORGANISM="Mesodinium pulex, Strain SPMC105" /LENGTH=77 /DNA_ID=CAMNT_0004572529 /DNA_START=174 /DNA_END=407 /DNA_ORIENTATION=+
MAADSKATTGTVIANKDTDKLHKFADNIWAAGAGTAADLDHVAKKYSGLLKKLKLRENQSMCRPITLVNMLENHLSN